METRRETPRKLGCEKEETFYVLKDGKVSSSFFVMNGAVFNVNNWTMILINDFLREYQLDTIKQSKNHQILCHLSLS